MQNKFTCCNHIYAQNEENKEKGNLFLGGVKSLSNEVTKDFKFGAVLTLMSGQMFQKLSINEKIKQREIGIHKWIEQEDDEECEIRSKFEISHQFIAKNLLQTNVLVHCFAGVSRSSTIVISYLMKKLKLRFQQANKIVRSKRFIAEPNQGFQKELQLYEQQLFPPIPSPKSIFQSKQYSTKFCNHIICFNKQGVDEYSNLFLGQASALSHQYMNKFKIKAVLTIIDPHFYKRLKINEKITHIGIQQFYWMEADDKSEEDILSKLDLCHQFIEKNLQNGNVFVHCQMGVSRSASVVISLIMKKFGVPFDEALYFVKDRRNQVNINQGFREQLLKYEQMMLKK